MRWAKRLLIPAPLIVVLGLWALFPNAQPYFRGDLPEYTYANAFADRANIDGCFRVSDIGPGDTLWCSDGTNILPVGGRVLIDQQHPSSSNSHTGNTTETELFGGTSIEIPANLLGINGCIQVDMTTSGTANANAKNLYVYFNDDGAIGTAGERIGKMNNNASSAAYGRRAMEICNDGATNSQEGSFEDDISTSWSTATGAGPSLSIDTTAATYISFSIALANGADTQRLDRYSIWVSPSP